MDTASPLPAVPPLGPIAEEFIAPVLIELPVKVTAPPLPELPKLYEFIVPVLITFPAVRVIAPLLLVEVV
jgi:hypothetical protein